MKPNNQRRYSRYNNNNRNNRSGNGLQNITRHTALESTGPLGKVHGTALQLSEKYAQAAKDAIIQNDRVMAETFLQFSDHYARLQNIAIQNETAARPTYQPAQTAPVAPTVSADALPDFDLPKNAANGIAASPVEDDMTEEDKTVQAMDLSIPIQTINQNHTKPRQRFTIRKRETKTDDADTPNDV